MPKNNDKVLSSINDQVKKIESNQQNFGPKLVSSNSTSQKQDEQLDATSDILKSIVGAFSMLISGTNNVDKYDSFKSSVITKNVDSTIFGKIDKISDTLTNARAIKEFGSGFADGFASSSGAIKKIMQPVVTSLSSMDTKLQQLIESVNGLVNFIPTDLGPIEFPDINDVILKVDNVNFDYLAKIVDILNNDTNAKVKKNNENVIKVLFGGNAESVDNFVNAISRFSNAKMIDVSKVEDNLNRLLKLLSVNGAFTQIFESVNKLGTQALGRDLKISIDAIYNILQLASDSQMISPIKLLKFNFNLEMFRRISIEALGDTINDLKKNLNADKNVVNSIGTSLESLDKVIKFMIVNIKESLEGIKDLKKNDLTQLFSLLRTVARELSDADGTVGGYIKNIIVVNDSSVKNISNLIEYFDQLSSLSTKIAGINAITAKLPTNIDKSGLAKLADMIDIVVDKFNNIDIKVEEIRELNKAVNSLLKVVVVSAAVLIVGALVMKFVNIVDLVAFTASLALFVSSIVFVFSKYSKNLKDSMAGAKGMMMLVAMAGGLLIAGSIIFNIVDIESAFKFTLSITAFMSALSLPFIIYKKTNLLKDAMLGAKDFALLMVVAGGLVVAGSLLFKVINWQDAMMFIGSTVGFMVGFMLAIKLTTNKEMLADSMKGVFDFSMLMVVTSGLVVAGSLLSKTIDFGSAMKFIGLTALFLGSLLLVLGAPKMFAALGDGKLFKGIPGKSVFKALGKIGNPFREAMLGARDFAILVIASGGILLAGSLLMKYIDVSNLAAFTLALGTFMAGIITPFALSRKPMKDAMVGAKEFAVLVAISAGTLLVGGTLLTLYPELVEGVAEFTGLLASYMFAILGSLRIAGQNVNKAHQTVISLAALTAVAGATLLIAGNVIMDNGGLAFIGAVSGFAMVLGGYVFAMSKWILPTINDSAKDIAKGALMIAGISLVTMLSAEMFARMHEALLSITTKDLLGDILELTLGITLLGTVMGLIGILAVQGPVLVAIAVGAGLITGISVVTLLAVHTLVTISDNAKKFNVKKINTFKEGVVALVKAMKEISNEFVDPWFIIKLPMVSASIASLSIVISSIASSVGDYANLKVPVYTGTKITGYRPLKSKDFNEAAKNVKKIVTVLGKAVISAYESNPQIFESADPFGLTKSTFSKVTKSLSTLGPMLATISKSVKTYASLRIPEYTGTKVTGYKEMKAEHFKSAANNVSLIITTLGQAVIDTYDKKPELFEEPALFGKSKFSKVVTSLSKLGPLISTIASSVQKYANFSVPIYGDGVDKDGKPKIDKYRSMTDMDFTNAATNVQKILTVLGQAVIDAYDLAPEMYEGTSFLSTRNKFTTVIKSNLKLGSLISGLGKAVAEMANLYVADEYTVDTKTGKVIPSNVRAINNADFAKAAENIKTIMTTLGKPIEEIANDKRLYELYDDSGWFGGDSKFSKVIEGNIKLSSLIGNIGKAVSSMASLEMITEWVVKDGKATPAKVKQMETSDFQIAAKNILQILTTLGKPIEEIANDKKRYELFDGSNSKFKRVIEGNLKLAELINSIGTGVKSYADLKMPIFSDKSTDIVGYRAMKDSDFTSAAINIHKILTTLGGALIETAKSNSDLFEDGEDSEFAQCATAVGSLGGMLSSISNGIQAYANMRVPDWSKPLDANGNPTAYIELNNNVFAKASEAISLIVENMGSSIMAAYHQNEEWFDDGEDSIFAKASAAISNMGEMVSNVSTGIKSYADLKIPTEFDAKGMPIKFEKMNEDYFKDASNNISLVITTLGQSIIDTFDSHQSWFEDDEPKFDKVIAGCTNMGEMIGSITESIISYAEGRMVTKYDAKGNPTEWAPLDDTVFTKASNSIKSVITIIGKAIDETFYEHKDWFDTPVVNSKKLKWGFGLLEIGSDDSATSSDPPFVKAVRGISLMGGLIGAIAKGVRDYANYTMEMATKDGKTETVQLSKTVFTTAATRIGEVITLLGHAINYTYLSNKPLFDNKNMNNIVNSFASMGTMVTNMATGIKSIANLSIPEEIDPATGKGTKYHTISENDFTMAKNRIKDIMSTVGSAFYIFSNSQEFKQYSSPNTMKAVVEYFKGMTSAIGGMAETVKSYANLLIADDIDIATGQAKSYKKMEQAEFGKAAEMIGKIISCMGVAIKDTVTGNTEIFGDKNFFGVTKADPKASPAYRAAIAIGEISKPIASLAGVIGYYATGKFSYISGYKEDGTPIYKLVNGPGSEEKMDDNFFNRAKANILRMFKAIVEPIQMLKDDDKYDFLTDEDSDGLVIAANITSLTNETSKIASAVKKLVDQEILDKSTDLAAIKTSLCDEFIEIAHIYRMLTISRGDFNNMSFNDYINKNAEAIQNLSSNVNTLFTTIDTIYKSYKEKIEIHKEDNFDDLKAVVANIRQMMSLMYDCTAGNTQQQSNSLQLVDFINNAGKNIDTSDFVTKANGFAESLNNIATAATYLSGDNVKGLTELSNGLNALAEKINAFPTNEFDKTIGRLKEYISTINKVELDKIQPLNEFTSALSSLAGRLGSLDKFTEVLANKITKVLNHLATELKNADNSITKAENLQKKRHELIKQSTDKIKEIMDQKMIVEISQPSSENSQSGKIITTNGSKYSGSNQSSDRAGGVGSSTFVGESGDLGENNIIGDKTNTGTAQPSKTQPTGSQYKFNNKIDYGDLVAAIREGMSMALKDAKVSKFSWTT